MVIPKFNTIQLDRLSEVLGNLGLLFFAALVLPIFTKDQKVDFGEIFSGLVTALGCVIGSIVILKGGER